MKLSILNVNKLLAMALHEVGTMIAPIGLAENYAHAI